MLFAMGDKSVFILDFRDALLVHLVELVHAEPDIFLFRVFASLVLEVQLPLQVLLLSLLRGDELLLVL